MAPTGDPLSYSGNGAGGHGPVPVEPSTRRDLGHEGPINPGEDGQVSGMHSHNARDLTIYPQEELPGKKQRNLGWPIVQFMPHLAPRAPMPHYGWMVILSRPLWILGAPSPLPGPRPFQHL